jgi:hypothetical protein
VLRYISEQIALRTGEMQAADVSAKTAEGSFTAREGERAASRVLRRWRRHENEQAP